METKLVECPLCKRTVVKRNGEFQRHNCTPPYPSIKRIARADYERKPAAYKGNVDGIPYLLYADEGGGTVYGPVILTD